MVCAQDWDGSLMEVQPTTTLDGLYEPTTSQDGSDDKVNTIGYKGTRRTLCAIYNSIERRRGSLRWAGVGSHCLTIQPAIGASIRPNLAWACRFASHCPSPSPSLIPIPALSGRCLHGTAHCGPLWPTHR